MQKAGRQRFTVAGDARRQRRQRRTLARFLTRLILAGALLATTPLGAVVSTTIAIDGQFDDWAGVLADPSNVVGDPSGDSGDLDHDLTQAAATWDTANLYLLFRRATASGNKAWRTTAYIDCDGDGLLETTDRIVWFRFLGNGNYTGGGVYSYVPATAGGDPITGDQGFMPGSQGAAIPGAAFTATRDAGRILIEGRLNWASLGVSSGAPVGIKFALGPQNGAPTDTTDPISLRRRAVTLVKPEATAASAGATVTVPHTLTNSGNSTETFTLTTISTLGWANEVRRGGVATSAVTLTPGQSVPLELAVRVPDGTQDGERETVTLVATCASDTDVSASVVDRISVGPLLVIPDGTGSMEPGSRIVYRAMVTNNSTIPRTVIASATSGSGWNTSLYESDGITSLGAMTLGANSTYPIVVAVDVSATAPFGLQDVTVVRAAVATDAAVAGSGTYTTTVRRGIEITPDGDQYAGPGTFAYFRQLVRNSTPTTQSVGLAGSTAGGWQVAYFADDGVTPISTVALAPNGGSAYVRMRVRVPTTAVVGSVQAVTSNATAGARSDSCSSLIRVVRLATFDSAGYTTPQDTFVLGSTVYARAMGFTAGQAATFRWRDPGGALTTDVRTTDVLGAAGSLLPLGLTSSVGTWTVEVQIGAAVTGPVEFYVRYDADIPTLSATDANPAGTPTTITAAVRNRSAGSIPASELRYRVWWDANDSGAYDAGDTWVDASGAGSPFGSGTQRTAVSAIPIVGATSSVADPPWTLPTGGLPFAGTWHVTAEWVLPNGYLIAERTTTFFVRLSTLSVSVGTPSLDFGSVDPGVTYMSGPVPILVDGSESFNLTKSTSGMVTEMGLTSELSNQLAQPPGTTTFVDRFYVNVPWDTNPGPVLATVTYTVVPD